MTTTKVDLPSPHEKEVEVRVRTEYRLAQLETHLQYLATKEDISKLLTSILRWLVPTVITTIAAVAGLITLICK